MADNLEYIDRFFKGELSAEESRAFDQRINNDPAFAEEVAFYASAFHAIRNELDEEKKKTFREIYQQSNHQAAPVRPIRKLWPYMAAAAVVVTVVFAGYLLLFKGPSPSPQQLADTYIKEKLQSLNITMSGKTDSLQKGKNLYNEGKFDEALQQFETLVRSDSNDTEAKKLAGLTCLKMEKYDKAILYFVQLENYPNLYSNPGKFYHAVTLIKRNKTGDIDEAKQLLQRVVAEDLDKKEVAEEWLKKW